jgi:hypothetical protein
MAVLLRLGRSHFVPPFVLPPDCLDAQRPEQLNEGFPGRLGEERDQSWIGPPLLPIVKVAIREELPNGLAYRMLGIGANDLGFHETVNSLVDHSQVARVHVEAGLKILRFEVAIVVLDKLLMTSRANLPLGRNLGNIVFRTLWTPRPTTTLLIGPVRARRGGRVEDSRALGQYLTLDIDAALIDGHVAAQVPLEDVTARKRRSGIAGGHDGSSLVGTRQESVRGLEIDRRK